MTSRTLTRVVPVLLVAVLMLPAVAATSSDCKEAKANGEHSGGKSSLDLRLLDPLADRRSLDRRLDRRAPHLPERDRLLSEGLYSPADVHSAETVLREPALVVARWTPDAASGALRGGIWHGGGAPALSAS